MLPMVDLELLNTSQKGTKWPINRVVTLVGRDDGAGSPWRMNGSPRAVWPAAAAVWLVGDRPAGQGGVQITGDLRCVAGGRLGAAIRPYCWARTIRRWKPHWK